MIYGADTTFLVQLEIVEAVGHQAAYRYWLENVVGKDIRLAIAPQVLHEFVHIVTDERRWERPLGPAEALSKAELWWQAAEVVQVFPSEQAVSLFFTWMRRYHLGRKRLLDTQLAATLWAAGIRTLITSNARDYGIFDGLTTIDPQRST